MTVKFGCAVMGRCEMAACGCAVVVITVLTMDNLQLKY